MTPSPLTRGVILAAAIAIGARMAGLETAALVAKAAATLCCIAIAVTAAPGPVARYRQAVVAGLCFGLAGDILLELEHGRYFAPGLGAFLVGHLAYLVAFTTGARLFSRWKPVLWLALLGGGLGAVLWRGIEPSLRAPVAAYIVVLCAMAAQARVRAAIRPSPGTRLAAVGATLFVVSDAALAINRFGAPYPWSGVLILATYWMAQWAIASSVRAEGLPTATSAPA